MESRIYTYKYTYSPMKLYLGDMHTIIVNRQLAIVV